MLRLSSCEEARLVTMVSRISLPSSVTSKFAFAADSKSTSSASSTCIARTAQCCRSSSLAFTAEEPALLISPSNLIQRSSAILPEDARSSPFDLFFGLSRLALCGRPEDGPEGAGTTMLDASSFWTRLASSFCLLRLSALLSSLEVLPKDILLSVESFLPSDFGEERSAISNAPSSGTSHMLSDKYRDGLLDSLSLSIGVLHGALHLSLSAFASASALFSNKRWEIRGASGVANIPGGR
mmetsp:Transcript_105761/g.183822  ORF Transcript_105761/g.183822 Transcript_105761/m.183822 type:complete len:239 (-) Transcript_105761:573-1289(-)